MSADTKITPAKIVDAFIRRGYIMAQFREEAIRDLTHELRRRTRHVVRSFARAGVAEVAAKHALGV